MESETPVTDSLQQFSSTWLHAVNSKPGGDEVRVWEIHGKITWMTKGRKFKGDQ